MSKLGLQSPRFAYRILRPGNTQSIRCTNSEFGDPWPGRSNYPICRLAVGNLPACTRAVGPPARPFPKGHV